MTGQDVAFGKASNGLADVRVLETGQAGHGAIQVPVLAISRSDHHHPGLFVLRTQVHRVGVVKLNRVQLPRVPQSYRQTCDQA